MRTRSTCCVPGALNTSTSTCCFGNVACVRPARSTPFATSCNNVVRCCVEMLRTFGQAFRFLLLNFYRELCDKHLPTEKLFMQMWYSNLCKIVFRATLSQVFTTCSVLGCSSVPLFLVLAHATGQWALFLFTLPSHYHVYIVKCIFSSKND